jgi:hypothetical protein
VVVSLTSHAYDKFGNRYPERRERIFDKSRHASEREFRGVDGEGGNVPDHNMLFPDLGTRHEYLTLRAGPDVLETGSPLQWWECLAFLADLPRWYIYVAYFFDYDVTMMIKGFPQERAHRLLHRGLRTDRQTGNTKPLEIGEFEVDYLPHKEFKVRRKGQKYWTMISDVGQFFQKPFLDTITKWEIGTKQEREFIKKGKSMRADFAEVTDEIRAYNAVECLHLEQLMTEFRFVCTETGYVPKKWQGPGNLASAMLERHRVPRREAIPILHNAKFRELAQAAYYGGRFETTSAGPILVPVYQYDINGAYVALLRGLPCLIHGSWRQIHDRPHPDQGQLWFGTVHYNHEAPRFLYNLPHRLKNGNIRFQKEGHGTYWSTELEAAERAGTMVEFQDGWLYEPHCECRWFDFVDAYYKERLALGKSTKGYVLKLAGNSCYGKIAQSIGYAPWANPVWAGLITAGCRAQLIDAYVQAPDECLMLATDGLFMTKPLNLPLSAELGEWEETIHPNGIFIVQPGIYFLNDEAKTRGVERGRINDMRPIFEAQWEKYIESRGIDHTVSVPVDNFITAKQALARNKWKIAGTWERTTRDVSYSWAGKRIPGVARWRDNLLRTLPYDGGGTDSSLPYDRIIGGGLSVPDEERYTSPTLEEAARVAEQPDWTVPLFDGPGE